MTSDSPRPSTEPGPERPPYEPPRIVVYDENSLSELIGPAVACARWSVGSSSSKEAEDDGDW